MKTRFAGGLLLFAAVFMIIAMSFSPDQGRGQDKKESAAQNNQGKGNQGKGKQGNDNQDQGKNGKKVPPGLLKKGNDQGQDNSGNARGKSEEAPGKDKKEDKDRGNGNVKVKDNGVIIWDQDTYPDRKKWKNNSKVTICHKFRDGNPVTISVSSNALKAHMAHGDVQGNCPAVSDRRFSDIFERRRQNYFDYLQNGQEQVLYSQSILDYALQRLAMSRTELSDYERGRYDQAELERRRAAVSGLEQNVSVLETLVAAAAAFVASRWL